MLKQFQNSSEKVLDKSPNMFKLKNTGGETKTEKFPESSPKAPQMFQTQIRFVFEHVLKMFQTGYNKLQKTYKN